MIMSGDLSGMMNEIKEAQQKVEVTANREIKSVSVDESLLDDTEVRRFLILTLNRVLKKSGEINNQGIAVATKSEMPGIPGMNLFK